jgi:hypothetical protein
MPIFWTEAIYLFFPWNNSCTPFACKKFLSLRIFPQKRFQGYQGILGQGEREIGPQARLFVRRAGDRPDDVGSLTTFAKRKKGYAARRSYSAHTTFVKIIRMD